MGHKGNRGQVGLRLALLLLAFWNVWNAAGGITTGPGGGTASSMTGTLGTTNSGTVVNTNILIVMNAGSNNVNGTYTWSASLNRYTNLVNGGLYAIYFDTLLYNIWTMTNGAGAVIYEAEPSSAEDPTAGDLVNNKSGFPFNWFINAPDGPGGRDIGAPQPPTGNFQLVQSGAQPVGFYSVVSPLGSGETQAGVGPNMLMNNNSAYPNALIITSGTTNFGNQNIIADSVNIIWGGTDDGVFASVNITNTWDADYNWVSGCEQDYFQNMRDCNFLSVYQSTFLGNMSTIGAPSYRSSLLWGESILASNVTDAGIGGKTMNIYGCTGLTAFGCNLGATNINMGTVIGQHDAIGNGGANMGAIGYGVTNLDTGTWVFGVQNANLKFSNNAVILNKSLNFLTGSGSPNSSVTAPVGSIYLNLSGGSGTTLYVKESGTGNTGWVGK